MPMDTSPDSKCPICLGRFDNVAYLDNCWHRFCFRCVQNQTKNKAECPLCKLPFISVFHTIRADNDFQEYKITPSADAASSCLQGSSITIAQSPLNSHIYDLHDNYYYLTPPHDEGSGSDSTVIVDSLGSSVSGVVQSPWDDETPGPSCSTLEKYGATAASLLQSLVSSDKGSAWKRIRLQPQVQAGVDSSDGDSSEHCGSTGYVNLCAERTPEMTEVFSDSEESIKKKRKYVKKEQSIQTLSRKRKTVSVQAPPQNSDSSHGHGPCKKCHSEHLLKKRCSRSRDGSKHQSKRNRRSRLHGTNHSQKARVVSTLQPEIPDKGGRSSQDDQNYCSRYKCLSYSQKTDRDGPSCRKRTHSKAHCSKKSAGPEFSIQPFTETKGLHSQIGLYERQDSYDQCRSRSPSRETKSNESKNSEKPGGKRKCKIKHLENTEEGSTMERHMRENIAKSIFSTFSDYYEYNSSLSDSN